MKILYNIDKYISRLLMISFFLPAKIQVVALFGACLYFVARTLASKEYPSGRQYQWALLLGGLYLLYLIAVPFTPEPFVKIARRYTEWRLSYLLLPLVLATLSHHKKETIIKELSYFVYGCFVLCLATNICFLIKYAAMPGGFHGVNHVTYRVFFEKISGLHPTYISMYIVFSLCILLLASTSMNKIVKYALFYSLLIFLLALFAKSPIIAVVIIFIHYAWLHKASLWQYKWIFAGMLIVLAASYIFIPFVSQRANEMTGFSGETLHSNVVENSISERKMIWSVDYSMLTRYWLTGTGPGKLLYLLQLRYFFYSLYYGHDISHFDPHNEYFYEWLSFGIVGILFFVFVLVFQLVSAIRRKNYLYLYLLIVLMTTFFTESVLARQQGIVFYAFFTSLFFFYKGEKKVE